MPANTPNGFPYPLGTDRLMDGDDSIHNLATAIDNDLYGGNRTKIKVLRPSPTSTVLDFGSIPANGRITLTINVPGAIVGDIVVWSVNPAGIANGIILFVGVTSANTVMVMASNYTAAAIDPAALTYFVAVLQFPA